jgi:hypothetical protein
MRFRNFRDKLWKTRKKIDNLQKQIRKKMYKFYIFSLLVARKVFLRSHTTIRLLCLHETMCIPGRKRKIIRFACLVKIQQRGYREREEQTNVGGNKFPVGNSWTAVIFFRKLITFMEQFPMGCWTTSNHFQHSLCCTLWIQRGFSINILTYSCVCIKIVKRDYCTFIT